MSPSEGLLARLPEDARDEYTHALRALEASSGQDADAGRRWVAARLVDALGAELLALHAHNIAATEALLARFRESLQVLAVVTPTEGSPAAQLPQPEAKEEREQTEEVRASRRASLEDKVQALEAQLARLREMDQGLLADVLGIARGWDDPARAEALARIPDEFLEVSQGLAAAAWRAVTGAEVEGRPLERVMGWCLLRADQLVCHQRLQAGDEDVARRMQAPVGGLAYPEEAVALLQRLAAPGA